MTHVPTCLPRLILLATALTALPVAAAPKEAGDRCEAAVADAVRTTRGKDVQEVQFAGSRRQMAPAEGSDETAVRGEGHYRIRAGATVAFSYSCAFNARSGATSGVLFREQGGPPTTGTPQPDWQPDLANINPLACETAAAALLKQQHPRVTGIQFAAQTRQLQPAAQGRTALAGQGRLQRAEGMAQREFRYLCEFERGTGRVIRAEAQD